MSELRFCSSCRRERSAQSFVRLPSRSRDCCSTCAQSKRKGATRVVAMAQLIASPGYLDSVMSKPTLRVNKWKPSPSKARYELHEELRLASLDKSPLSELAQCHSYRF